MNKVEVMFDLIQQLEELRANLLMEGMDAVAAELNKVIADLMWLHRELERYE